MVREVRMPQINDAVWQDYDSSGQIREKLEVLKSWIPNDVHNILDVGCGNGIISNALAADFDVTGIDISETALKAVKCNKIQCSATEIPVSDNSYDLVLSSEMLEHLSDEDLIKAIGEMKRITKRYIIVSVPNEEGLAQTIVKCRSCGTTYHAYGHLHCFTTERLSALFSNFKLERRLQFGPLNKDYNPVLLWIRERIGGQFFHPTAPILCPHCNSESYVYKTNVISKTCNLIHSFIGKPKPYWLMVLFSK